MRRHAWIPMLLLVLAGCPSPETTVDGSVTPGTDSSTPGTDGSTPGIDGSTPGTDGSTPAGWHAIELPGGGERVTGIHCTSASACVIATDGGASVAHLYATDGNTITATLVTADDALSDAIGIVGSANFLGLSAIGDRLIARLSNAGGGYVSATGDFTQPSSWTVQRIGSNEFNLNAQYGFGHDGTRWVQFRHRIVYATTDTPGPTANWEEVWAPAGIPPVPSDLLVRRAADPTICDSEPGYSEGTRPTQPVYVAPDLGIILTGANSLNQTSSDATGVCISTDGGNLFHLAPFAEVADMYGPIAMTCTSDDHCVVFGGQLSGTTYGYVSSDATMGASSTWERATIPSFTEGATFPRHVFFAPDGMHGWVVGSDDNDPFLWATVDGGATWTDATSRLGGLTDRRLWAGFAIDNERIVVGGEGDTLLASY